MTRITFKALLPMTASAVIHGSLVAAMVLAQGWAPATMPVLVAELVEPEAPRVVQRPPSPSSRLRGHVPRPIKPPGPIATRLPFEPVPARPTPEPPRPRPEAPGLLVPDPPSAAAPEPPVLLAPGPTPVTTPEPPRPAASEPSLVPRPPATAGPPATVEGPGISATADPGDGPASAAGSREPDAATAPPAAARGPALAAIPSGGVTERAIPRGGYQYRPAYPSRARSLGIQGTTLLHVLVSDRGRVAEVIVEQSAGHPDLDQAAAGAVRRWRFEPARRGTEPVETWVQLPFEFRLR